MPHILSECRACRAPDPFLFLPLGDHAPAQMLIRPGELAAAQPSFPLNTQVCLNCGLIEIADQIPQSYFEHYLYVPSGAVTMTAHFEGLAAALKDVAKGGLIVDIGCNDGTLLATCARLGCKTLGIDPAQNIAEIARKKGVEVLTRYFTLETAEAVRKSHGPAKTIVTTNTFNHIHDLHAFMKAVGALLAEDGTFVIEVPTAHGYLKQNAFDNIYHEHLSQFSLLSIVKLGAFFGFDVTDLHSFPDIHGGSMRIFMTRRQANIKARPVVQAMLAEEAAAGILKAESYEALVKRVEGIGKELHAMLSAFRKEGKKIAGYGASARGNTLITYFGIGTNYLDFLVDRNALKHNHYSPNTRIPIKPVEAIESEKPDVLFVLAWNFFDEIRQQQADFVERGGRFIVPLPVPRLV